MAQIISFPLKSEEKLVLYEDRENYHFLQFNAPPDNRFTPETIPAIIEAITYIRTEGDAKPLITTSTSPKFFSNGLDFERALATPNFFDQLYYPLMRVFLEFPYPTIALVNGHAFAAGFMVAECHDYVVMNPDKGWLCMNELEFGAPLMAGLMSVFRVRFGVQLTHKITLNAHRFSAKEALKDGLITALGGLPEAEAIAQRVAKFSNSPSYGQIRKELFRELLHDLRTFNENADKEERIGKFEENFYDDVIKKYKSRL